MPWATAVSPRVILVETFAARTLDRVSRVFLAALDSIDRTYWAQVARAVRDGASEIEEVLPAALSVRYPLVDELIPPWEGAMIAGWRDQAEASRRNLQRYGRQRLFTFALAVEDRVIAEEEALAVMIEAQELVPPEGAINDYAQRRVPPLRESLERVDRRAVAKIIADEAKKGAGVRDVVQSSVRVLATTV